MRSVTTRTPLGSTVRSISRILWGAPAAAGHVRHFHCTARLRYRVWMLYSVGMRQPIVGMELADIQAALAAFRTLLPRSAPGSYMMRFTGSASPTWARFRTFLSRFVSVWLQSSRWGCPMVERRFDSTDGTWRYLLEAGTTARLSRPFGCRRRKAPTRDHLYFEPSRLPRGLQILPDSTAGAGASI